MISRFIYDAHFSAETIEERRCCNTVNDPWDSSGIAIELFDGDVGKERAVKPGNAEPVLDILFHLISGKGSEMIKQADPLPQRQIGFMIQPLSQVCLTDENQAEEIYMIELKICQESYFLKSAFRGYELCFVNDDDRGNAGFIVLIYPLIDCIEKAVFEIMRDLYIEPFCHGSEKLKRGELGINDYDDTVFFPE